jgi:hypothetical protein
LCGDVGYVMTYGAFGTDPPTPFGVRGLNRRRDDPIRINPRPPAPDRKARKLTSRVN